MTSFTPPSLGQTANGNLGILGSNPTSDADLTDFLSSLSSEVPMGVFNLGIHQRRQRYPLPLREHVVPGLQYVDFSSFNIVLAQFCLKSSSSSFIASPGFTLDPWSQSLLSSQPSPTFQTVDPASLWNSRGNSLDQPIYISQKVGDKLDAVRSCLIGTFVSPNPVPYCRTSSSWGHILLGHRDEDIPTFGGRL